MHYQRLMSISLNDFYRLLPRAILDLHHTINPTNIQVQLTSGLVNIGYLPQAPQRHGILHLPVLAVDLVFEGSNQAEIKQFMHQFDRAYQRGGG